jgi:hypothetical protein
MVDEDSYIYELSYDTAESRWWCRVIRLAQDVLNQDDG